MKLIKEQYLTGERTLFQSTDCTIQDSIFGDGESPLKESRQIEIYNSIFKWKYPLWYCHDIKVENTTLLGTARSGIWYTHHIAISHSTIEAPKTFRRSSHITLNDVDIPLALESFWNCQHISLHNVTARGDYFGMNSENIQIQNLHLTGNYCFDGSKNMEVRNSRLISKDAFWNCENVVVYDSTIIGEYLGWNSKNITFINCTIESLQGLCYIENLKLVNCKLINTTLAFEFCENIDADICSRISSITNPISGVIKSEGIDEIILDKDKIDPERTIIMTKEPVVYQEETQNIMNC